MAESKKDRHDLALQRFKLASEAMAKQRERELKALDFASGNQWDAEIKRQRTGDGSPSQSAGARPCITIDKVGQPIQQVTNAQKNARLAIKVSPKGHGASDAVAETFQGLIRNIEVDSNAPVARNWAYERMAQCGLGYYRIHKEYANDGDFDQDITIRRILNQASVYLDPFAQEPDWSDGLWALITEDLPKQRFEQLYGKKSDLAGLDDMELTAIGDRLPSWVRQDEAGWSIRVAEYWYVTFESETLNLAQTPDGGEQLAYGEEIPEGAEITRRRTVQRRKVDWCLIDAVGILEETTWEGRYIPIIPVIGKEYNVGGERKWSGVVEPAMDACRLFNYTASAIAESTAIAPKAPFILDPEQIEGYESWWQQANTRNFPYLPRKAFNGMTPYPNIERQTAEPPIQALTLLLQQADQYIKATTGVFDPSLGNQSPDARSGRAILALQKQSEQGNSNYLDNMASISMHLEGKILLDLIPHVYDRPGRVVRILEGANDKPSQKMLGTPFVPDQQGQPQPVPPGTPGAEQIDLASGEYSVVVEVGKAFSTRREEATGAMVELMGAAPNLAPVIAPFAVKEMDFPGANDLADVLMKTLPPQLQPGENGQPPPEVQLQQMQAQMQQLGQMSEMMAKELQEKTRIIETDTVKKQFDLEQTKLESATRLQIAEIQSQTQFGVAEIKAMLEDYKLRLAHIETIVGHQAQADQQQMELEAEFARQQQDQQHQAALQGAQSDVDTQEAEAQRQQEMALQGNQQAQEMDLAAMQQLAQPQPGAPSEEVP